MTRAFIWLTLLCGMTCMAQTPAPDAVMAAAQNWIGRALILRECPAGDTLVYDAAGHLASRGASVAWTLAGFDLQGVTRTAASGLELTGNRVAIRYQAGSHTFERTVLKGQPMRIAVPVAGVATLNQVLTTMFSTGIDPGLERSLPSYWSHYFLPQTPWNDGIADASILPAGAAGVAAPMVVARVDAELTPEVRVEKQRGVLQMRVVVDASGMARRATVRQPLGLGLEEEAVEALGRWRFSPGMKDGVAVPAEMVVSFDFGKVP